MRLAKLSKLRLRNEWRPWHLAVAVVLVALGVAVTFDAWRDIVHIASTDQESSHIFLVPVVVVSLVWVRSRRLRHCRLRGTWMGPLLVAAGWAMYSIGDTYMLQSVWHGGAVLIAIGCLLSVLGKEILVQMLPAFVALLFLVPIPGRVRQQIAIPLERVSAQVTQGLFELIGVPIERSGNLLSINGTDVTIAEACNGLRMVFALTLVSYAFAFGTPLRGYVRVLILAACPFSAVLCNVVRLVPTVWLYGYHPGAFAEWFHDASGWVMLGVSFLILMGIVRLLRWALIPVTQYTLAYD